MRPTYEELIDALAEMVAQHCTSQDDPNEPINSMACRTNADAMRLLERAGVVKCTLSQGRLVRGRFVATTLEPVQSQDEPPSLNELMLDSLAHQPSSALGAAAVARLRWLEAELRRAKEAKP